MERQICLDMHEDLTKTQTRFQVFVVKSRIEQLISISNLKEVIANTHVVEEIKKKNNQTQDVFELNNELINLKEQLKSQLHPNENQSNTFQRLIVVQNITNDLQENYKQMKTDFFDQDKCKNLIENAYNPLHSMMKQLKESCQRHCKNSKLKPQDLEQITQVVDQYIKDNTTIFIQKSQDQEFYKNVDISYSHLLHLQKQFVLILEDIVDFIEEKAKVGVEFKPNHNAEDYLRLNGINMQNAKTNIEKRKENLKNITSIKGLKNKENLDEIAHQIKADERWIDIIIQSIETMMMLRRDVHDKLQDHLTFPPSFSIPEGKEVQTLIQFIDDMKEVVEKQLDNFEDPIEVPLTTVTTTTEAAENKQDDKIVRFSMTENNFSVEGDQMNGPDKILKETKLEGTYRLGRIKLSLTRSMNVALNFLDFIQKQIKQHQENEKVYQELSNNYLIIMDKNGRSSFLELYDFIVNIKSNFDSFCTGLVKTIPVQLKFLINLLQSAREKYINYIHEIIVKRYAKENVLQIGLIVKKIENQFDLNQYINFLKEQIENKYQNKQEQISNQLLLVRDAFIFVEEQLNGMEEIVDEVHKTIGNPKSLTNTQGFINDIANEDEMYFWQRFCNQVNDFYTTYDDIKKKKIYIKDETQIERIFQSKVNALVSSAQGKMGTTARNICEKYKKLILQDYVWFTQTLPQQITLSHHKSQNSLEKVN